MNRYLLLVAMAFVACTKLSPINPNEAEATEQEISFLSAVYATSTSTKGEDIGRFGQNSSTTKTNSEYTGGSFGVYAWSEAVVAENKLFMNDESVSKDPKDNIWRPSKIYYWPKTQTVDFIAYAPKDKNTARPEISSSSISYTDYDVAKMPNVDLLFSDKAVGYGANEVTLGTNSGVPILFRHALSKLSINAKLAYDRKKQKESDGTFTVTRWLVKITNASYSNLATKGSVRLELKNKETQGLVGWKVVTEDPNPDSYAQVWTVSKNSDPESNSDASEGNSPNNDDDPQSNAVILKLAEGGAILNISKATSLLDNAFILPQTLSEDNKAASMDFSFEIKTYRWTNLDEEKASEIMNSELDFESSSEEEIKEQLFLSESGSVRANFIIKNNISAFEMGKNYVYNIKFTPTKGSGMGGSETDPNLDDVSISFAPSIEGWDKVNTEATLYI